MMDQAAYLLAHLVALYVCVALGFVGFGMMLNGHRGAQLVAAFLFWRPLQRLASVLTNRLMRLLASMSRGIGLVLLMLGSGLVALVRSALLRPSARVFTWLGRSPKRVSLALAVIVLLAAVAVALAGN